MFLSQVDRVKSVDPTKTIQNWIFKVANSWAYARVGQRISGRNLFNPC